MNFQQIVQAVKEGKNVCWRNRSYKCVWFNYEMYIVYGQGQKDESIVTLRENMFGENRYSESDFFVEEG